jgi:hypothetical protein
MVGAADRFLQVSSGSFGGANHLITFNAAQWGGNYLSAGVNKVTMDLKNFGTQTLSMRIALRPTGGSPGTAAYSSSSAFSLPADGAWHHAAFLIDAADLTGVNGPTPLATFLTSVGELRVLDAAFGPSMIGDVTNGQFGVDNVQPVAEPSSIVAPLLGVACFGAAARLARARSSVSSSIVRDVVGRPL